MPSDNIDNSNSSKLKIAFIQLDDGIIEEHIRCILSDLSFQVKIYNKFENIYREEIKNSDVIMIHYHHHYWEFTSDEIKDLLTHISHKLIWINSSRNIDFEWLADKYSNSFWLHMPFNNFQLKNIIQKAS